MRNLILAPFYLLLLFSTVFGSELSGIVRDAETNRPLVGAHVQLDPHFVGTTQVTDDSGGFTITGLIPGETYRLSASYLGYRVSKRTIEATRSYLKTELRLEPILLSTSDVVYTVTRATEGETPSTFTDLSGKRLREQYWSQDIPPLLSTLPSVYAYSESGAGIGYTYLKIRGFDHKRVGVTVNNIPHNDPEDGVVYWVDMPDLAANLQDVQLQRGVGYSTQGSSGAFGGSLNLVTLTPGVSEPGFTLSGGTGSYNTRKWSTSYNSGIVNNTYGFYGRFSKILSDGYRDRSGSDLWSYFLTGMRYGEKSRLTINVYGGVEETHAAWDATAESDLEQSRTYNPITYENTIDWFTQPHYELHHEWQPSDDIVVETGLFYIHGTGYYEQYKEDRDLYDFGYTVSETNGDPTSSDLVNQKWVYKDHYGWTPRLRWEHSGGILQIGGDLQYYTSEHEGFVIWAQTLPDGTEPHHSYYRYTGEITKGGLFVQENYEISDRIRAIGDLEMRMQQYTFKQLQAGNFRSSELNRFTVDHTFLNPKLGLHYQLSPVIGSYMTLGLMHRAPVIDEYWDTWSGPDNLGVDPLFSTADTVRNGSSVSYVEWSKPAIDPERVINLEAGASWKHGDLTLKLNGYWMDFLNEIVPAGGVRDGSPITDNADRSIHRGIEIESSFRPESGFTSWLSISLSSNKLVDYTAFEAEYDDDWNLLGVSGIDLGGNNIALFPSRLISAGLGYKMGAGSLTLDIQHVGKQYLDNTQNEERTIDPSLVMGMTLSLAFPELWIPEAEIGLSLRINNLLDEEYETSGYYYGENYYYVGATRNYFLGVNATF